MRHVIAVVALLAAIGACSDAGDGATGANRAEPPEAAPPGVSLQFRPVTRMEPAERCPTASPVGAPDPHQPVVVADDDVCYTLGPSGLTPERLASATPEADPATGVWTLNIDLLDEDAATFAEMTRRVEGQQLAIVVDGRVVSAPTVHQAVTGGEFQISGEFSEAEIRELARRLSG